MQHTARNTTGNNCLYSIKLAGAQVRAVRTTAACVGDTSTAGKLGRIRPATPADGETIYTIVNDAYRTEKSWTTEVHLVGGERITLEGVQAIIARSPRELFVFELASGVQQGTGVVGCICAEWGKHHSDLSIEADEVILGLLAVAPAWQSKGIGTELLQYALEHARTEWTCASAVMWVISERKDILSWYIRAGFLRTGESRPFVFPELQLKDIEFHILKKRLHAPEL